MLFLTSGNSTCFVIGLFQKKRLCQTLGATIALNLVPLVLKKIFLLEIVKNGICLGGASKKNALFSK